MSILHTRFRRCDRLIDARRSAGVRSSGRLASRPRPAFVTSSPVVTVGCDHAVEASEIHSWFRHQSGQSCDFIERRLRRIQSPDGIRGGVGVRAGLGREAAVLTGRAGGFQVRRLNPPTTDSDAMGLTYYALKQMGFRRKRDDEAISATLALSEALNAAALRIADDDYADDKASCRARQSNEGAA